MTVYQWNSDLETGNSLIDSQHKKLIEAINNLLKACETGKGRDELENTMNFLIDYTAKHFRDEERLQLTYRYPDYQNHLKLHAGFEKTVKDLSEQLKKDGPTVGLVSKVSANVGNWLILHIKREDVKVANHIRENSK